jgi:hypothetical protein
MTKPKLKDDPIAAKKIIVNPRKVRGFPEGTIKHIKKGAYGGLRNRYKGNKIVLGKKLFVARTALSLSCDNFDYLSGVSCPGIRRIEKGEVDIQMNTLYDLCFALKIHPKMMMTSIDDLDLHRRNNKMSKSLEFRILNKDANYVRRILRPKADENNLKKGVDRCDKYFDRLIAIEPYKTFSWTAIVGAALGMYVGGNKDTFNFYVGADLSVKLFKELNELN